MEGGVLFIYLKNETCRKATFYFLHIDKSWSEINFEKVTNFGRKSHARSMKNGHEVQNKKQKFQK